MKKINPPQKQRVLSHTLFFCQTTKISLIKPRKVRISLYLPIFVYSKKKKMIFGNKVRELREKQGLLLRQLAAILEMDTATISKIELGTRQAKKEHLPIFSTILKIDLQELETLWLADKLYDIIENEECGLSALKLAEREAKYKKVSKL